LSTTRSAISAPLSAQVDVGVLAAEDVDVLEAGRLAVGRQAQRPPDPDPVERDDLRAGSRNSSARRIAA
jgi:hypothetical protein